MIRELIYYNDSRLRTICMPVEYFDEQLKSVMQDLADTIAYHQAAGAAAALIGVPIRAFTICYGANITTDGSPILCAPQAFINPEIIEVSEEVCTYPEGSISIPGIYENVTRPKRVKIRAQDLRGDFFEEEADFWRARVILHEMDYLDAKLFIDYLDDGAKIRIAADLKQCHRQFHG